MAFYSKITILDSQSMKNLKNVQYESPSIKHYIFSDFL